MKRKNKAIIITQQIISLETKELIRTIDSNIQKIKFCSLSKSCNDKEILNSKIQKKDHYWIKEKKKKVIIIGDSMIKKK